MARVVIEARAGHLGHGLSQRRPRVDRTIVGRRAITRRGAMPACVGEHHGAVREGDRMLIPCEGGRSISRLVRYPPPLEIEEHGGTYVLVDDGPPELWRYDFVVTER